MKISDLCSGNLKVSILDCLFEVYDNGSRKDKDVMAFSEPDANGDVYEVCGMCGGSGRNTFSRGGIHRSKGVFSTNNTDKIGGPCGTCHGKGEVFLWNKNELDAITNANSVEELKQNSPDFYNILVSSKSPKYNAMLADLDNGKHIPESVVNAYMTKKMKDAEPKAEVIKSPFKDDKRFRPSTHNRTINRK